MRIGWRMGCAVLTDKTETMPSKRAVSQGLTTGRSVPSYASANVWAGCPP